MKRESSVSGDFGMLRHRESPMQSAVSVCVHASCFGALSTREDARAPRRAALLFRTSFSVYSLRARVCAYACLYIRTHHDFVHPPSSNIHFRDRATKIISRGCDSRMKKLASENPSLVFSSILSRF